MKTRVRWRSGQGFRDAVDQEIGDDAGVERARADGDEVGGGDGVQRFRRRRRIGGVEHQLDDALAAGGDFGFAAHDGAVFHARGDSDVGGGGGENVAASSEDFRGELDGLGEVAGHFGERGDEEVAEVVAAQFAAAYGSDGGRAGR